MGAELRPDDMEVAEEGITDDMRYQEIANRLEAVRMDPFLIDPRDKDNYDELLNIVDPTKRRGPDDEPLLIATLTALSDAVSKIDIVYHHALLHNIFTMCLWHLRPDTRDTLLYFITKLAAVADQFLRESLQMLVNNFAPPAPVLPYLEQPRWLLRKKEIHYQLHQSLNLISETVPLATRMLADIIDRSMPRLFDHKAKMVSFVECMLGLDTDRTGNLIGALLLAKVVDLLTELDVNITWEDILQEEHNKGMFDMELEDLDDDEDNLRHEGTKALFGGNACAEKLDSLMVVVCEHLKSCQEQGRLHQEFNILMTIFRTSVLKVHKSKFAQFIMFYACSLDPEVCGLAFALFLTDIFIAKKDDSGLKTDYSGLKADYSGLKADSISRMSAVSYVGSFLSRARFISADIVVTILKRLVFWCQSYCDHQKDTVIKPENHPVFYACCQAVMYVLCFRLRSILDYPIQKQNLFELPFGYIFTHKLQPLKVCLPLIVNEFLRQAKAARLFNSHHQMFVDAVESDLSKAFGGSDRLDMFFPFDPYLLKESDRYMRPNFEFWSMIKTTYSDDDDELEDLDAPEDVEIDLNTDDLEITMNKMSITPRRSSYHSMAMTNDIGLSMPAKIRPSVSPPS